MPSNGILSVLLLAHPGTWNTTTGRSAHCFQVSEDHKVTIMQPYVLFTYATRKGKRIIVNLDHFVHFYRSLRESFIAIVCAFSFLLSLQGRKETVMCVCVCAFKRLECELDSPWGYNKKKCISLLLVFSWKKI